MDNKAFFDLTARMREAQKWYFSTRSTDALKESKRLEREIDTEIKRVQAIIKNTPEPISEKSDSSLFFD